MLLLLVRFFNSFYCSCSGFSMYFTFLSVISTLLFILPLCIRTFCYHYFVFISVVIWIVKSLLIRFLIHSIVVVLVFLCLLLFWWLSVLCCLCCHCEFEPSCPFVIVALYLFLFLFSLLTHCISKSYCRRYLYDLVLALLVWLLTLLVYNFPYGDFIVN